MLKMSPLIFNEKNVKVTQTLRNELCAKKCMEEKSECFIAVFLKTRAIRGQSGGKKNKLDLI